MSGAREVLGFHTAQLNRPSAADGSVNQLQAFVDAGMFRGTAFPDFRNSHRWAALTDTSQPLEKRARSYLAANCSFCHGEEGRRVIGTVLSAIQDLDYFTADFPLNYINLPAKFDYGIPGSLLVYGGNPDKSILVYRMRNRAMDKMPPLATAEPDTTALRVVSEWIGTLPPPVLAVVPSRWGMARHRAWIRGSVLHLDAAGADKSAPRLLDGQGREVPLDGSGGGKFRLPRPKRAGHLFRETAWGEPKPSCPSASLILATGGKPGKKKGSPGEWGALQAEPQVRCYPTAVSSAASSMARRLARPFSLIWRTRSLLRPMISPISSRLRGSW